MLLAHYSAQYTLPCPFARRTVYSSSPYTSIPVLPQALHYSLPYQMHYSIHMASFATKLQATKLVPPMHKAQDGCVALSLCY